MGHPRVASIAGYFLANRFSGSVIITPHADYTSLDDGKTDCDESAPLGDVVQLEEITQ